MVKTYPVLMLLFFLGVSVGYAQWPTERLSGVVPTPEQSRWQDLEYGAFLCLSLNTFADLEWSDGTLSPSIFNPSKLDARAVVRTIKSAGMKYIVLVCKHHDGFCIWRTDTTEYSVKNSPYKSGKGDVVWEFADACKAEGIKLGVYLSIWDRHDPRYLNDPGGYIHVFKAQTKELLTRYGDVAEFWIDPAKGDTIPHPFDYPGTYQLVKSLQPRALTAIAGVTDIGWVGNEEGYAPETQWNVLNVGGKPYWNPTEADVPIRAHWFWKTDDANTLKTEAQLLEIYHKTVGRGSNLLLNVTLDRRGKIPVLDANRLLAVGKLLRRNYAPSRNLLLGKNVTASGSESKALRPKNAVDGNRNSYWKGQMGSHETTLEVNLRRPTRFNRAMMQEMIAQGQQIEAYRLEYLDGSTWKEAVSGTTVGHKKIDRFLEVTGSRVRLTLRSKADSSPPTLREFGLYHWIGSP